MGIYETNRSAIQHQTDSYGTFVGKQIQKARFDGAGKVGFLNWIAERIVILFNEYFQMNRMHCFGIELK